MTPATTARRHPLFARCYARNSPEGLSGRVIEVGAGTGAACAHYPPAVTGVPAIEPDTTGNR